MITFCVIRWTLNIDILLIGSLDFSVDCDGDPYRMANVLFMAIYFYLVKVGLGYYRILYSF